MTKKKVDTRKTAKADQRETRSFGEMRELQEDGTFEGYLTVWDTVDSYNSTFKRGAFANTIKTRGEKVKIFYDHKHLIGSSLELREDDRGVYGRGKLNLAVDKAKEAYEFMRDGTLEGLSFTFSTIADSILGTGVRSIDEVELFEFGPVIFPSNEAAVVTNVRSKDFATTLNRQTLYGQSGMLLDAISFTLDDIWWSMESTANNVIGLLDAELAKFHAAYLEFAAEWVKEFWNENRSAPSANQLAQAMSEYLQGESITVTDLATRSSFTVEEAKDLKRGKLITTRSKLSELPEAIKTAHQEQRSKAIEDLCSQLREGLTEVEKRRMFALLEPVEERTTPKNDGMADAMKYLEDFKKSLTKLGDSNA